MSSSRNPESLWFGFRSVLPEEKTRLVRDVFDSVATRYDLMNDLMSGGVHRLWKDRLIRMIRPLPGRHYLDVAGGTGDIALRLAKAICTVSHSSNANWYHRPQNAQETRITVCDLNPAMVSVGRDRALDRGYVPEIQWSVGNAQSLPIPDESVDVYTIAFGLRNVTLIDTALAEAVRVLKPGGRFFCLEFSRVEWPVLDKAYELYSKFVIPKIGAAVANDRDSYQYLIESIRQFPNQEMLVRRMTAAGLKRARYTNLSAGIAAIHTGWKI